MVDNFLQREFFLNFTCALERTLEQQDPVKYRTQMHDLMVDSCQGKIQDNYPK